MISNSLSLEGDFENIYVMILSEYAQGQPGLLVQLNILDFHVRHYVCKN